jgi:hypothetical protein
VRNCKNKVISASFSNFTAFTQSSLIYKGINISTAGKQLGHSNQILLINKDNKLNIFINSSPRHILHYIFKQQE